MLTTIKEMHVIQSKFSKPNPKHLKHGGTPGALVPDPPLKAAIMSSILTNKLSL